MENVEQLTYCNPLSIADIPEGRWLDFSLVGEGECADYRSIADPSVVYHDGKWILYPSYSVAYVTEDFVHWKHVDIGVPHFRYSPAVVQFRDQWYIIGHGVTEMYVSDSPLGPFRLCGHLTGVDGKPVVSIDGCFLADDDRLYFYWHMGMPCPEDMDVESLTCTVAAELDPEKPWQMITEPVRINQFDPNVEWQRTGEHHQNARMGWIEGQWAMKIDGKYYLLYSGSGTQYSSYTNGVLISEEGPLTGFKPQTRHDPLTEKRHGLMRGAGHGSLVRGPKDTLWIFYTCFFGFNHMFERRIGMDPVGIDENGELYCPAVTETPQFAPGVLERPELGNDAGWLPLTFMERPTATSCLPGREPIYASDDSVLTWWQRDPADEHAALTWRLCSDSRYEIYALRIIWRDVGMDSTGGVNPGPFRYVVEYAPDAGLEQWKMLLDASENAEDLCIDYRRVSMVKAYGLRLRIVGAPKGIEPGLVSFTAFGLCAAEK